MKLFKQSKFVLLPILGGNAFRVRSRDDHWLLHFSVPVPAISVFEGHHLKWWTLFANHFVRIVIVESYLSVEIVKLKVSHFLDLFRQRWLCDTTTMGPLLKLILDLRLVDGFYLGEKLSWI